MCGIIFWRELLDNERPFNATTACEQYSGYPDPFASQESLEPHFRVIRGDDPDASCDPTYVYGPTARRSRTLRHLDETDSWKDCGLWPI